MHTHITMRFDGQDATPLWSGDDDAIFSAVWDSLGIGTPQTGAQVLEDVQGASFGWRLYMTPTGSRFTHTYWKCDAGSCTWDEITGQ